MDERHKYEYQVELDADSGPARVVRMVGENKKVLEIGCGPGSITKLLATRSNCHVTALDVDADSIDRIRSVCDDAYQADLNDLNWPKLLGEGANFEVIVAADVLEHVYEPLQVLKAMSDLLGPDGYIVVSLPHVGHSVVHACLLEEDFEYGDFGLLDKTHIRFFGIKNIQKIFEDAGLKIVKAEFVVRNPEHTEFAKRWSRVAEKTREVLAQNPYGWVYQVIVQAVSVNAPGLAVALMSVPVVSRDASGRERLKARLRTLLSERMYSRLRSVAAMFGVDFKG